MRLNVSCLLVLVSCLALPAFAENELTRRTLANAPESPSTETAPIAPAKSAPSPAQQELQSLVSRQWRLFSEATRENNPNFDEDTFKQRCQELLFDYEAYVKKYPDVAAGYAAYGIFLSKVDMRRQSVAILLKANKLDPDQPLVKNQIGNYLAEEGKVIEAANYYTAAIKLAPEEPLYHYQLGTLLHEAQDLFVKSGQWTAAAVERASFNAFQKAAELAPDRIEFVYRHCESYYDLTTPRWDEALSAWDALEAKVSTPLEKQTIRLHRANIYIRLKKMGEARELLASVSESALTKQKEKLIADLPENGKQ
jgi:tetratricopeptide (TPR) repeat protein